MRITLLVSILLTSYASFGQKIGLKNEPIPLEYNRILYKSEANGNSVGVYYLKGFIKSKDKVLTINDREYDLVNENIYVSRTSGFEYEINMEKDSYNRIKSISVSREGDEFKYVAVPDTMNYPQIIKSW